MGRGGGVALLASTSGVASPEELTTGPGGPGAADDLKEADEAA